VPPVARTYLEAYPDTRQYGARLIRGIRPALRQAERRAELPVRPDTRQFGRRLLGGMAGPLKAAAGLMAGAFAGRAIINGLRDIISEAREAAKVTRQINAVIKSTGGVANVSARDVDRLTTALSNKAGVDDELIAGGAAVLLTFKGVRNETGKNNDIFNQATTAALDMTAALNDGEVSASGLRRSNIQLGKALNDPVKGITALTRVGVTFDQGTKDRIKLLVSQGKTLEAQKIILRELGTEFGGAAAAAADPMQRLRVAVDNLKERIGLALLPTINRFVTFLTTTGLPAISKLGTFFANAARSISREAGGLGPTLGIKIDPARLLEVGKSWAQGIINGTIYGFRTGDWTQLGGTLGTAMGKAIGTGVDLFRRLTAKVDWLQVGRDFGTKVGAALIGGGTLVASLLQAAAGVDWFAVGQSLAFIMTPLAFGIVSRIVEAIFQQFKAHPWETTLAVLSLIPLGRAAGLLAKTLGRLPILGPLLKALSGAGRLVEVPVFGLVRAIARFFLRAIESAFPGVGARFGAWALRWILGISAKYGQMRNAAIRFVGGLLAGVFGSHGLVTRAVGITIRLLTAPFRGAGRWLVGAGRSLVGGLVSGIRALFGAASSAAVTVTRLVTTPFRGAGRWLVGAGRSLVGGLVGGIRGMFSTASGAALQVTRLVVRPFSSAGRWLLGHGRDLVGGLVSGIRAGLGRVGAVLVELKNAIVGGIKRLFGIGSPSTVMAGIGGNMVAGLVKGLLGSQGSLRQVVGAIGVSTKDLLGKVLGGVWDRVGGAWQNVTSFLGGGVLGGGWRRQMAALHSAFPGLPLISGFRPGAITATGRQSYHALGRAVDVPPRMDVFNWIRAHFGRTTKELIFTPAGGRQIHNGRPHVYTGVTAADHWSHIHWAMDQGGWLRPGWNPPIYNGTGRPEQILGPGQAAAGGPGELAAAVAAALHGARVELDGQRVGELLVEPRFRDLQRLLRGGRSR
jgi:hypothetical protein